MKKKVIKSNNELIIKFTDQDIKSYDIKEGDILDLSDMIVERTRKIKNNQGFLEASKINNSGGGENAKSK